MKKSLKITAAAALVLVLLTGIITAAPFGAGAAEIGKTYPEIFFPTTQPDENSASANSVWIWANPEIFGEYEKMYCFLYVYGGEAEDITDSKGKKLNLWGAKACKMESAGNNYWFMDFDARGITLDPDKTYACVFSADWKGMTCDLIFDTPCFGLEHAAIWDGTYNSCSVEAQKNNISVFWQNTDEEKYGRPLQIDSVAQVFGKALPKNQTREGILKDYLCTDSCGLQSILGLTGSTAQEIIDYVCKKMELDRATVEQVVSEANAQLESKGSSFRVEWSSDNSSLSVLIMGDVNGDEKLDISDSTLTQMCSVKLFSLTYSQRKAADINKDGKVDITDATLIQMIAAKLITVN